MPNVPTLPLAGARVAITRPVGCGGALARRVRALGGVPLSLPGSRLHAMASPRAARSALRVALACDVVIVTSPAAVRFAAALMRLRSRASVLAPGRGTARALQRIGLVGVHCPDREDSEGLLALPALRKVRGQSIGIIGAAGGRGLLERELAARGASIATAHVYERMPARLDRRHADAVLHAPHTPTYVLLSSAQALGNIVAALPANACRALLRGTAVASSDRLVHAARAAGFARTLQAASAHADDLLATAVHDRSCGGSLLA